MYKVYICKNKKNGVYYIMYLPKCSNLLSIFFCSFLFCFSAIISHKKRERKLLDVGLEYIFLIFTYHSKL